MMAETLTRETDNASAAFLTSSQAAKRLGLSMATIQKMVDSNVLQGWKTFGGHRRISLASVVNYQSVHNFQDTPFPEAGGRAKVMLVIETSELTAQLKKDIVKTNLPLQAVFQESLTEAFLDLLSDKYDLLVIHMNSHRKQQEKVLEVLQKFMSTRNTVAHTLIVTQESDLLPETKLGEPVNIQVLNNELSPLWLLAYLSGFTAQRSA
jgi:excisionase family DNA binding protein